MAEPPSKKSKEQEVAADPKSPQGEEGSGEMVARWQVIGRAIEEAEEGEENVFSLQGFGIEKKSNTEILHLLKCVLMSEINGSVVTATIHELEGRYFYKVAYTPTMKGWHQLCITFQGKDIVESPYNLKVKSDCFEKIRSISGVEAPWGVAFTKKGDLVVTERGKDCVSIFSLAGEKLRSFGSSGSDPGQFNLPCGVAVGLHNTIFVADSGNHRIQAFTEEGIAITVLQS